MKKNTIVLNEAELQNLIKDCVNEVLNEGFFDRLKAGVQGAKSGYSGQKMLDRGTNDFKQNWDRQDLANKANPWASNPENTADMQARDAYKRYKEYQQLAKELSIEDTCIFYGRCEKEKLFAIEAEMDFMVSASLFESFDCAVAEGMMLGKPTVATKSGGVESIVTDENGILVEKGSADELYRGLTTMYQIYENYNPQEISDYANQKFSMDGISRKYVEIYKEIVEDAGVKKK